MFVFSGDLCSLCLFALFDNGKDDSESGEHAGSDDIETHGKWIGVIDAQQAACGRHKEAPSACCESKGVIFNKAILRIELASGLAERDIGGKHPEVTHGHADGIELGELLEDCGCPEALWG